MAQTIPDSELREILMKAQTIAVVGLSPVAARPSYGVARYLKNVGYEIFGVRPASPPSILGSTCVESLMELSPEAIDIVDVFRNAEALPALVDQIEAWLMKAQVGHPKPLLWLQEGVTHPEAEEKAKAMGLKVVSDLCILKERERLLQ